MKVKEFFGDIFHSYVGYPICSPKTNAFLNSKRIGASTLENLGNFFLTPFQFFWMGRVINPISKEDLQKVDLSNPETFPKFTTKLRFSYEGNFYFIKAALMVVLLIPGTILGVVIKGISLLNPDARKANQLINRSFFGFKDPSSSEGILSEEEYSPPNPSKRDGNFKINTQYMACLKAVNNCLNEAQVPCLLAFGTALGMYRHGGMIPGDHDIDLIIMQEDIERAYAFLKTHLDPTQYEIQDWSVQSQERAFFKVFIKNTHLFIDIYVQRKVQDEDGSSKIAHIYPYKKHLFTGTGAKKVGQTQSEPIPYDVFYPAKNACFDGVQVKVPNQIKTYLHAMYGKNLEPCRRWNPVSKEWEEIEEHPFNKGHHY